MGLKFKDVPVKKKKKNPLAKVHRYLIIWGRQIARRLTEHGETVTTHEVRRAMIEEGIYQEGSVNEHWLGSIFNRQHWDLTGQLDIPKKPTSRGKVHTLHPVKIWKRKG